jgi:hypothetical protein
MLEVTLEERSERRDYKLPAVFGCYRCFNNQDKMWSYVTIFVHEGVRQKCGMGHINEIHRKCSRCGTNYPLYVDYCHPCEERITEIILREKLILQCDEKIEEIKKLIRKKLTDKKFGEGEIEIITHKKYIYETEKNELLDA